jgi:hypothetical protein
VPAFASTLICCALFPLSAFASEVTELRLDMTAGVVFTDVKDSAATPLDETLARRPVLVGAHLAYFWAHWLGAELWSGYQFDVHRYQFLFGPRFRVQVSPLNFFVGFKAGLLLFDGRPCAGLSPDAGVEVDIGHLLLGVRYAFDLPLKQRPILSHRLMLTEGWRF